jgi:predicted kinase
MSDEELLSSIEKMLRLGSEASSEEIESNALEYIQTREHFLPNKFLHHKNTNKKAIFMAGGSGAGKSETALTISKNEKIDIVDTDDIRKICPLYSGKNSHLFQKASSEGVSILMNHLLKNNLSFILNKNFTEYSIQKEYIERALNRGYDIEIIFVYRDKNVAKNYTKQRENIEERVVPDDVFEAKYTESIQTTKQILDEFENISFRFFDLSSMEIVKNQDGVDRLLKLHETLDNKILI